MLFGSWNTLNRNCNLYKTSGGGIDVFISANKVKDSGKVFGIDMTEEMLEKTRNNARQRGFTNVEFKKGWIISCGY
ncbi:MAG: methyltransferase domain-containing protein [Candidatus Nitrosopolaris sp.]